MCRSGAGARCCSGAGARCCTALQHHARGGCWQRGRKGFLPHAAVRRSAPQQQGDPVLATGSCASVNSAIGARRDSARHRRPAVRRYGIWMPTHPNQRNHASPLRTQRCCAVLTRELQLRYSSAPVHWWQHHQHLPRPKAVRVALVARAARRRRPHRPRNRRC